MKSKKCNSIIVGLAFLIMGLPSFSNSIAMASEAKTLKIGSLINLENPLGRDAQKLMEAEVAIINQKGGLPIGGDRYKIDLILYNTKGNAETGRAAAERVVFRDGAKFIIGDTTVDAWVPVTEPNKVVVAVFSPSPAVLKPNLKYIFQASFLNTATLVNWSWFIKAYPEKKKIGGLFADYLPGHADARQIEALCKFLDLELVEKVFYPVGTTDFSALATRIKNAKPDVFTTAGGGPLEQVLSLKAMREAGWQGPYFGYRPLVPGLWQKIAPLDRLEGSCFAMSDIDKGIVLGTTFSTVTKEAYDAYVAKYGEWDSPLVDAASPWYLLKAALQQAHSIDPDKVSEVTANGLKFDSPFGPAVMISRPDMGNSRTIDAVFGTNMATVEKGKVKPLYTLSVEEAFEFVKISGHFGQYPD